MAMKSRNEFDPDHFARIYDVPPWLVGIKPPPRFARVRWALRRIWPRLVWGKR